MEWCNPTYNLNLSVSDAKQDRVDSKSSWYKTRDNLIKHKGSTCDYCGGQYQKNMNMISLDGSLKKKSIRLTCKLCHMIVDCLYQYQKELVLCWSKTSQLDIVRKSIDHIKKTGTPPSIKDIDPDAKKLDLSLIEFIDILASYEFSNLPKKMKRYKVFMTPYFDCNYIDTEDDSMFIDEEDGNVFLDESEESDDEEENNDMLIQQDEDTENYEYYLQREEPDQDLDKYTFGSEEKSFLRIHFKDSHYSDQFMNEMSSIIYYAIKTQQEDSVHSRLIGEIYHNMILKGKLRTDDDD